MEYVDEKVEAAVPQSCILCCECGIAIAPNAANMCLDCLKGRVDITEGIPKQAQLTFCKLCERYLSPPATWLPAALESKELLQMCLKRMKGLDKVRLVDAGFIWTEPHSKRVKVKLTVQQEVMTGLNIQQQFVVEYVVLSQMCDACHKIEAKDYWRSVVQVRQKVPHKKTLFYLEQLILKHNAHKRTSGILPVTSGGIDFFFANKQEARKLVDFIETVLPSRYKTAEELVSHDTHSNTFDYKHTFSVMLAPICKDSLVCLPKKLAQSLGNFSQICLCYRISNLIHLIDPTSCQIAELSATRFWQKPFEGLMHSKQLTEFTVMDIEPVNLKPSAGAGQVSNRHTLAEAWVVRSSELGQPDVQEISVKTHLGHLLSIGDSVMGYDVATNNPNNDDFTAMKADAIPDVVLVKKVYANRMKRNKKRNWQLKHLSNDGMIASVDGNDFVEFLEELEEDPALREHVNIYRKPVPIERTSTSETIDTDADDLEVPQISLQEMLDDLQLDDVEMEDVDS